MMLDAVDIIYRPISPIVTTISKYFPPKHKLLISITVSRKYRIMVFICKYLAKSKTICIRQRSPTYLRRAKLKSTLTTLCIPGAYYKLCNAS